MTTEVTKHIREFIPGCRASDREGTALPNGILAVGINDFIYR